MVALEAYDFVAQWVAIYFQLDVLCARICLKVSPEVCVDAFTLYKLPHGLSYRRLLGQRVQLASFKALACAHFPVFGRVFLLSSV